MYQALYRKWRPRSFDDVAGQEHVTGTLKKQISSGRLSHAYLFVGTRGTGKTTCAKILARAVNCTSPVGGNPCNECDICRGIEDGSILDVLELDAASNNGVDNVRALREEAVYSPASAKRRVYIIDEVHMLTSSAFNALLKILEEPPEHLLFILATTELHKVPATILSRCQRFSFKRLPPEIISARLSDIAAREGFTLTPDAAEKLARLADGSMRDALSLLDQCAAEDTIDLARVLDTIGLTGNEELLRLASAVFDREPVTALSILDGLFKDGRDMASLLNELTALMRDILINSLANGSALLSGGFDSTALSGLCEKTTAERLFFYIEKLKDASYGLTRGGNARLSVETCLINICHENLSGDLSAVLSRISRLEDFCDRGVMPAAVKNTVPSGSPVGESSTVNEDTPQSDKSATHELSETIEPSEPESETPETIDPPREEKPGDFWNDILKLLRDDMSVYSVLGDKTQISAKLDGRVLTILASNPFAIQSIESKTIMEPLRAAAEKALGREVSVKVESEKVSAQDALSKLEGLSAFNNVKFE